MRFFLYCWCILCKKCRHLYFKDTHGITLGKTNPKPNSARASASASTTSSCSLEFLFNFSSSISYGCSCFLHCVYNLRAAAVSSRRTICALGAADETHTKHNTIYTQTYDICAQMPMYSRPTDLSVRARLVCVCARDRAYVSLRDGRHLSMRVYTAEYDLYMLDLCMDMCVCMLSWVFSNMSCDGAHGFLLFNF